jgi:hypothetical protein
MMQEGKSRGRSGRGGGDARIYLQIHPFLQSSPIDVFAEEVRRRGEIRCLANPSDLGRVVNCQPGYKQGCVRSPDWRKEKDSAFQEDSSERFERWIRFIVGPEQNCIACFDRTNDFQRKLSWLLSPKPRRANLVQ